MYLYYLLLVRTSVHMGIHTYTPYLCKCVYVTSEMPRTLEKSYSTANAKGLQTRMFQRQALGK